MKTQRCLDSAEEIGSVRDIDAEWRLPQHAQGPAVHHHFRQVLDDAEIELDTLLIGDHEPVDTVRQFAIGGWFQ